MRASSACASGAAFAIACAFFAGGCSSASTSSANASGSSSGSNADADSGDGGTVGDSGCRGVLLTVKDLPISSPQCLVSIAGGKAAGSGVRTQCVPTGVTKLSATPLSPFTLAPGGTWHGTDGDKGAGDKGTIENGTSTATVTVNTPGATKCVWACCPSSAGDGCTTASPCP